jgi:hypothetical protein
MPLLHKLNRSLQQKGVITTICVCFRSIPELLPRKAEFDPWDAKHNVETTSRMGLGGLTIRGDSSDSSMYAPVAWDVLEDAIKAIPSKDATFIDYGSGKGRALLVASHFPFREIIGVEFAEELHDIACRNIASYRSDSPQLCHEIWSVLADAREFQPPRRALVALFHNPFGRTILVPALERLSDYPDRVHIISIGSQIAPEGESGFRPTVRSEYFTIYEHQ